MTTKPARKRAAERITRAYMNRCVASAAIRADRCAYLRALGDIRSRLQAEREKAENEAELVRHTPAFYWRKQDEVAGIDRALRALEGSNG